MEPVWADVDRYLSALVVRPDPVFDDVQRAADDAGLPSIAVSPPQGKLLHLLVRLSGARRVLEVGRRPHLSKRPDLAIGRM